MRRKLDDLEQYAVEVILEKRHGFRATLLRAVLRILSFVYLAIVQFRLYLYRKRILKERQLGCFVISIGNLTVGGTGNAQYVSYVAVGDVNGDGKPDLAVVSNSENESGNLTIFLNNGSGGFTKQPSIPTGITQTFA